MVRSQQDTAALPASRPFAGGQAGYDYFADEQHYRSLADRVLAGLRQGGRIVLVTGAPPVNLPSLAAALTEATAGKHTMLAIACGGEFNEQELRCAAGPSPLFLFHQAERLLDGQLAKLCSYLALGGNRPAGVLLGVPGLAPRLEKLQPSLFEDGRAIRFNFYELGRDEIDVFMRRQLRQSSAAGGFAVDEINWIADLSSGDPAQVNRLSRLMLELTGGVGGSNTRGNSTSHQTLSPSAPRWRRAMRRPARIGILLCLGLSVLLMPAGRPEFGGRIDGPAQSGGNGSLAPEQVSVSPPAVVASSRETAPTGAPALAETAPPADPPAAPALAETGSSVDPTAASALAEPAPPADPTGVSALAETGSSVDPTAASALAEPAPPADPSAAPALAETAPPADPTAAPALAETAPPADPTAAPALAEPAPPADPTAAPALAEPAPPADPTAAPALAETAPPADPTAAPAFAETAPPADPIAASALAETAPSADPTGAPALAETAPPADPTAAPALAETAPPADPTAAPALAETAPPADPTAVPALAETDPTGVPALAETAPPADPTAVPALAETDPTADPTAAPALAETAPPADPTAASALAETGRQAIPAAVTADKARAPLPLPAEQITALLARGDAFVRTRDIASARLFYERAADAGNGRAALRMGESFDRAFLDSIGIYRMIGDRQLALSWYRRARDLGDTEAAQLLQKLEPR